MPDDLDYDPQLLQAMLGLDSLDNSEALSQMTNLDRAKALRQFNPGKGPSALGGAFRGIQTIAAAAKAKGLESKYADDQVNSNIQRQANGLDIIDRIGQLRKLQKPQVSDFAPPTQEEITPPQMITD